MPGVDSNMNVPPDPEIVARAWALSKSSITDIVGTRIATRLPQGASMPFLVIENGGSSLLDEDSQAAVNLTVINFSCYAGRWGGSGNKAEPDYTAASNLAQVIYKEAFTESNTQITTSSGIKAWIYGMSVATAPQRIEEDEVLLANFLLSCRMTYRYSE